MVWNCLIEKLKGRTAQLVLALVFLAAFAFLFYWLLPVAAQSRLSADHVRWAFATSPAGAADRVAVSFHSLSPTWAAMLNALDHSGFVENQEYTFSTAAALSGWIGLAAFGILFFTLPLGTWCLVTLTPALLWSVVVPGGFVVPLFGLALIGFLARPEAVGWKRNLGSFLEGFVGGMTPAAWGLSIAISLKRQKKSEHILRITLIAAGLALNPLLALFVRTSDSDHSMSWLPVLNSLRALGDEDVLGVSRVILGSVGETAIGLVATVSVMIGILTAWLGMSRVRRVLLVLPFVSVLALWNFQAWRLAHPGWNTILEDASVNISQGLPGKSIVFLSTATEEAVFRFTQSMSPAPNAVAVRPYNILDPWTLKRIDRFYENQEGEPSPFRVDEYRASFADTKATSEAPIERVARTLFLPNLRRGVSLWLDFPPRFESLKRGVQFRFLMNGIWMTVHGTPDSSPSAGHGAIVKSKPGEELPSQILLERRDVGAGFVRSHPRYREARAGRSLEIAVFERYSYFHIEAAKRIESQKTQTDWALRARAEKYAALKKAPWLSSIYEDVCGATATAPVEKQPTGTTEKVEQLDVCLEIAADR